MRRKSFEEMNCSVAQTLEVVGEWWTMLIVRDCFFGITRFDDFQQRLGISRNILTDRLDHLVERGVLVRVPSQEHPVRRAVALGGCPLGAAARVRAAVRGGTRSQIGGRRASGSPRRSTMPTGPPP